MNYNVDKGSLSKSCPTTTTIKYEFNFITHHYFAKYSKKDLLTTTHCACVRPKVSSHRSNFDTNAGQQQVLHLLMAKTTHSLLTVYPELKTDDSGKEKDLLLINIR